MRTLITLALVAAPMMAAGPVGASSSATAKAYVNIVAPVYVESTADLSFGTVLMDQYGKGGTVTMTTETKPNSDPTIKDTVYSNCAAYGGNLSPAFFHYKKDSRYDVNVMVEGKATTGGLVAATIPMGNGVTLTPNTDLPADACGVFNPLPASVSAHHFGVGGVLKIAPDTFGERRGTISVVVAYN